LQAIANLAVFAGIRKDISAMDANEQEVLTELLLLMDKFDLYGKLAIPKRHDVEYEVPELYRLTAQKQGVFVNPAFKENFGLTLIEAAAVGLPVVATNMGGPYDIVENCQNGLLVDVNHSQEMTQAIKKILVDQEFWKTCSQNGIVGVREHYTWEAHTQKYLEQLRQLTSQAHTAKTDFTQPKAIGKKFISMQKFFFTDIDDTLIGDDEALAQLLAILKEHHEQVGFGMVTGRPLPSVQEVLAEYTIQAPDMIISSVGMEIYYGVDLLPDKGWASHISAGWEPEKIKSILGDLPFLHLQEEEAQRQFKISYFMEPDEEQLTRIHQVLTAQRLRYTLIYSRDMFLDILPHRASKGKAIRYLSYKWNIALGNIVVAGDSENDEDMLRGDMLGIIVGNHHEELDKLQGLRHIYFASAHYAAGILEGFEHYRFPFSEAWAST
jgi:sucrose-phosphate synthase